MSTLYEELREEVRELLAELGQDVVFRRSMQSADLVSGSVSTAIALSQTLRTAVVPASGEMNTEALDIAYINAVKTARQRRLGICEATDAMTFLPGPGDKAVFNNLVWTIVGCTPVNIDGTLVTFTVSIILP